jgi:hypothetical protein
MWSEIPEPNEFRQFISFQPIWLYATINSDKVNLWQQREKRLWPDYAVEMTRRILDNKSLARYACIVQVCLSSIEEVYSFIENARKCGIYVKSVYKDEVPEGACGDY